MSTQSLIILAVVIAAGLTISKNTLDPKQPKAHWVRVTLAALIMGVFLNLLAAGNNELARSLSWLIIVAAILTSGAPLLARLTSFTQTTTTNKTKPKAL